MKISFWPSQTFWSFVHVLQALQGEYIIFLSVCATIPLHVQDSVHQHSVRVSVESFSGTELILFN